MRHPLRLLHSRTAAHGAQQLQSTHGSHPVTPNGLNTVNHDLSFLCAQGQITLVGAGPGDPELLTIQALKPIQAATVLLVDDLVSEAIAALARTMVVRCS